METNSEINQMLYLVNKGFIAAIISGVKDVEKIYLQLSPNWKCQK